MNSELIQLGLTPDALAALKRQGFVSKELRLGRVEFKLRYRLRGAQRVKSLGQDAALAEQVASELASLQAPRRHARRHRQVARGAGKKLRGLKRELAAVAGEQGLHFHGRRLRQARRPATIQKP